MEVGWVFFFPLKISLEFQRVSLEEIQPLKNQEEAGRKERPGGKVTAMAG